MEIINFNATRCRHCYKCVRHCGVKAIMVRNERAEIMPDNCILCGKCLEICPQSAKTLVSDLAQVKAMLRRGERVAVSIAPAYRGLLPDVDPGRLRAALLALGFAEVRETAEGAALVTAEYAKLMEAGKMENIITTCCPSANDLVEKYYPELTRHLAPVVSPMIAHAMLLKRELGDDCRIVFLGPCIAKKRETEDFRHEGWVDAVLHFGEVRDWLREAGIAPEACEPLPFPEPGSGINRLYPVSGGVVSSVLASVQAGFGDGSPRYQRFYVHGEDACIDLCESMKRGELSGCFIEMNICQGGCIKGPAVRDIPLSRFKVKLDMEEKIARTPVPRAYTDRAAGSLTLRKVFLDRSPKMPVPAREQIREILAQTGKREKKDELNCGACGYATCVDKAVAVFQKKAELNMCIPFMHEKAESFANLVMETSPNAVILVDSEMKILEYSAAGEAYFGRTRDEALSLYLFELIDPADFQWVLETHQHIHGRRVYYEEYDFSAILNIVYIEKENAVLGTFIDITKEEKLARQEYEKKLETVDMAQRVISRQMMVAQEIAGLLGETTAETKVMLTKLCRSILEEEETKT